MRVLFIRPTLTAQMYEKCKRPTFYEPLGIAYLAAYIREKGHESVILDCLAEGWRTRQKTESLTRFGLRDDEIEARIKTIDPDVIGIECMFTGFDQDCLRTSALAKQLFPEVPVIVGGADASARADKLIQNPNIDIVVRGEGETTLLQILECFEKDNSIPHNILGTTTKECINNPQAELSNLDEIPFPARDLLPMDVFLDDQRSYMPYAKQLPVGIIMSSRGCPFDCIFCSTTKIWKKWRARSPKNIVDEIEFLATEYGIREIAFQDDSFLVDRKRIEEMCHEILRRNLNISWTVPQGLTVKTVTEDILKTMREAGLYRVCFPIECGDPDMQKYIRKKVDLQKVLDLIEYSHKIGLWTYGNFMIGFPEQTADSIEKTAQFVESCGLDMINCYATQPYAGSDLYTEYEKLGLLENTSGTASTQWSTTIDTMFLTAGEVQVRRDEIYQRFTRKRIMRMFTLKGIIQLIRKMNTPKRFIYTLRVFITFMASSLLSGRFSIIPETDR